MEDNGGKLKKLEKGSARVSPNVDGSDSVHFLRDVLVYHFRVWQVNQVVKMDSPCCWEVF